MRPNDDPLAILYDRVPKTPWCGRVEDSIDILVDDAALPAGERRYPKLWAHLDSGCLHCLSLYLFTLQMAAEISADFSAASTKRVHKPADAIVECAMTEKTELPADLKEHTDTCSTCQALARELGLLSP